MYLVNVGGSNVLTVINPSRCDATHTAGCRRVAPSVPGQGFLTSIDPATNTIYAGNLSRPEIAVISGATCHVGDLSGCAPVAEIPTADPEAKVGAVDDAAHTLYASDPFSDTVSVINTKTCNATHTTGCGNSAPAITVGPNPGPPVLNAATRTLYVPFGNTANRAAVVNAATIKVGLNPQGVAINDRTHTVYVANNALGDMPGTVSVINGVTCNGSRTSGCAGHQPTVTVGRSPTSVAVDTRTGTIYVTDSSSAAVSVINGSTCKAGVTSGCRHPARLQAVGSQPFGVGVNQLTSSVYVTQLFQAGSMSILQATRIPA